MNVFTCINIKQMLQSTKSQRLFLRLVFLIYFRAVQRKIQFASHPQYVNPFPNKPWFLRVCSTSLLKSQWEKEKLLVTSNFSFSHSVFYPFGKLSSIFIKFKIVVFKLFQFGKSKICRLGKD